MNKDDIKKAIEKVDSEFIALTKINAFLLNIENIKYVPEDIFHLLYDLSLLPSNALVELIEKDFPTGTSFKKTDNYITFDLYGYEVKIPLFEKQSIFLDISSLDLPREKPTKEECVLFKSLILKLEKLISEQNVEPYKQAHPHMSLDELKTLHRTALDMEEEHYTHVISEYNKSVQNMKIKKLFFLNTLFPELFKFSKNIKFIRANKDQIALVESWLSEYKRNN